MHARKNTQDWISSDLSSLHSCYQSLRLDFYQVEWGWNESVLNTQIRGRESGQKSHTKSQDFKKMHVYSATYKKWHIHGRKACLYVNIAGPLRIQKYTFTHKHIPNTYKCPANHFWSICRKLKQPHRILQAY